MEWETVIGLEVHVQLSTKSKIFSGASTAFGAEPNLNTCVVDFAMPGVLPVLNKEAVNMAIKLGLGLNSELAEISVFDRKNYFYPDLPKGYQITQMYHPIIQGGYIDIPLENGGTKRVRIHHAHLEEDAGKSLHESFHGMTGIDLNRAGTALIEVVSEPDMRSAKEAVAYLKALHTLVRYLGICDGNMAEGSFRCDANVSVKPKDRKEFGTRAEIKNVNSFKFVEKAINYEIQRQIDLIENGGAVVQETRLYDANKDETRSMRSKENAGEYLYFPDPDLLPVKVTADMIEEIKKQMPELPQQKKDRFIKDYHLTADDAQTLTQQKELATFYEAIVMHVPTQAKLAANWLLVEVLGALNKNNLSIEHCPVTSKQLADMIGRIADNTISGKIAKTIFESLWNKEGEVDDIIDKKGLKQITDTGAIEKIIADIIAKNPSQAEAYRGGKVQLFGYFVGETMKATQGKANPAQVNEVLKKLLN